MQQIRQSFKKMRSCIAPGFHRCLPARLIIGLGFLFSAGIAMAAEPAAGQTLNFQFPIAYVLTFLFLMLGPFKIIEPFARVTKEADPALTRKIALEAVLFSSIALLVAAFAGEYILTRYGIPLPILALAAGIILFLVALKSTLEQFAPHISHGEDDAVAAPTVREALMPIAFPAIVTPYGIAATVVFLAFSPDIQGKLTIGALVLFIMFINLIVMLNVGRIGPLMSISLAILGAVISVIQVALGLQIINNSLRALGVL
jgi:multiple antibiotic resistance protein